MSEIRKIKSFFRVIYKSFFFMHDDYLMVPILNTYTMYLGKEVFDWY